MEMITFGEMADKENVTPADYAVEVRGIPIDAKDEVRTPLYRTIPAAHCIVSFQTGAKRSLP